MIKLNQMILLVAPIAMLSGCASIVDGTSQTLSVKTVSAQTGSTVPDAQCALKNDKGTYFVKTPGTVVVHRSYDALNLKCTHPGYSPGVVVSKSFTKGMAFGNLLFGGLIGAGVDMADGAAYNYPNLIKVPLTPASAGASGTAASPSSNATTGAPTS
jgi:uncharacterized protein YceK